MLQNWILCYKIGYICWFLFAMITHKMEPEIGELKKNIDQ